MHSTTSLRLPASVLGLMLMTAACGGAPGSITASIRSFAAVAPAAPTHAPTSGPIFRASPSGQTGPSSLTALHYNIKQIALCEEMVVSGNAFYPSHCLTLLQRAPDARFEYTDVNQDLSAQAAVARGTNDGFVDLMDSSSVAKLQASVVLASGDAHPYNWGFVSWYLPVKLHADIGLSDGSLLHTHDGSTMVETNPADGAPSGSEYRTDATTSLVSGPASPAVAMLTHGGTWFKFQKPLNLTASDVSSGEDLTVDLAFNPEGLIKGSANALSTNVGIIDSEGHSIQMPELDLAPVPHRASETVFRETYLASVSGTSTHGSDNFDVRLELYSVKEDATHAVYGASLSTLANPYTQHAFTTVPKVSSVRTNSDGSLDLLDASMNVVVAGFQRQVSLGDSAAATLGCDGAGLHFAGCGDTGTPSAQAVSFTLTANSTL